MVRKTSDEVHKSKPSAPLCKPSNSTDVRPCFSGCGFLRITTSIKPEIPSVVDLSKEDPLVGRVLCDDIVKLYRDELKRDLGALSAQTMARVRAGLCHALAI